MNATYFEFLIGEQILRNRSDDQTVGQRRRVEIIVVRLSRFHLVAIVHAVGIIAEIVDEILRRIFVVQLNGVKVVHDWRANLKNAKSVRSSQMLIIRDDISPPLDSVSHQQ